MVTLDKQNCPTCGQSVNEREIVLFEELVRALFQVWLWAKKRGIHEFSRRDIKQFLTNENISARFGDWVLFGGLVYHPNHQKGEYGLNIPRCDEFFAGFRAIPTVAYKNPLTGVIRYEEPKKLGQIKKLRSFLTENYEFIVKYREEYEAEKMKIDSSEKTTEQKDYKKTRLPGL